MRSQIVYSFAPRTLTNTASDTFTVPDFFPTTFDLLPQFSLAVTSGSPTVIVQSQVSASDLSSTLWTTVRRDTLTAASSFVVNAAAPSTVQIPRTMRRFRLLANQTGTAVTVATVGVSAKRFPN
jgi:hypothetical protein